jgi:hypothetical protein
MLKLKDEVDVNNKLSIFVHKSRGRKLIFDPQTVHQSEYPKYKLMGFNIFRCTNCGFDTCFGDCTIDEVEEIKIETIAPEYSTQKETNLPEKDFTELNYNELYYYAVNELKLSYSKRPKKEVLLKDIISKIENNEKTYD